MTDKKTYFVSDVHLGLDVKDPAARERRFAGFLNSLPADTDALYLLGDIWDFWYEYRDVVPKGYVRVFSALQQLMDRGVDVYFFTGNHDIWAYSYFEEDARGVLKPGAAADLVILDRDPTAVPPMEIRDIQVLRTIKDGRIVFDKACG